jgi:hypothetical protein
LFTAYEAWLGLSIGVYRLAFHRVRKFSGPLFAALTKWEAAYAAYTTQRYHHKLL